MGLPASREPLALLLLLLTRRVFPSFSSFLLSPGRSRSSKQHQNRGKSCPETDDIAYWAKQASCLPASFFLKPSGHSHHLKDTVALFYTHLFSSTNPSTFIKPIDKRYSERASIFCSSALALTYNVFLQTHASKQHGPDRNKLVPFSIHLHHLFQCYIPCHLTSHRSDHSRHFLRYAGHALTLNTTATRLII